MDKQQDLGAVPPLKAKDIIIDNNGEEIIIDGTLAKGGAGQVFRGVHERHGRVAVKVTRYLKMVPDIMEELRWSLAYKKNISMAPIISYGIYRTPRELLPEIPFLVMPYYKRGAISNVGSWLSRYHNMRIPLCVGAKWLSQIAQTLHTIQIIHRDIKPDNMLLSDNLDVLLADFGLAVPSTPELRKRSCINLDPVPVGTPAYMSPEQFFGAVDLDPRSDIYSLGLMLYEFATGNSARSDIQQNDIRELKERFMKEGTWRPDPEHISHKGIQAVFTKATQFRRAERYSTLLEFAEACEGFIEGHEEAIQDILNRLRQPIKK